MKWLQKIIVLKTCFYIFLYTSILFSQEIPKEGLQSITPEEMKKHVYYLASD